MLKYFALPETWNSRWTARSIVLELLTFLSAPAAIGFAILSASFVRIGEWPILPSALIEFLCLIYAFCALGFPILPRNQELGWRGTVTRSIWIAVPALAALVVWVMRGINQPELFVHLAVIISSASIAYSVQRQLLLTSSSVLPPVWLRRVDGVRLGILVAVIAGAAMFYVLLPNFVFSAG